MGLQQSNRRRIEIHEHPQFRLDRSLDVSGGQFSDLGAGVAGVGFYYDRQQH